MFNGHFWGIHADKTESGARVNRGIIYLLSAPDYIPKYQNFCHECRLDFQNNNFRVGKKNKPSH
jgi:hypothetical protein